MFERWFKSRKKDAPRAEANAAAAPPSAPHLRAASSSAAPADRELAARRARVRELLLREYDFEGLSSFDLVEEVEVYCGRLIHAAERQGDDEAADLVMEAALHDAILKSREEGLPREIAGQRLAALFSACRSAADWQRLPRAAAVAQGFVEAHLRR